MEESRVHGELPEAVNRTQRSQAIPVSEIFGVFNRQDHGIRFGACCHMVNCYPSVRLGSLCRIVGYCPSVRPLQTPRSACPRLRYTSAKGSMNRYQVRVLASCGGGFRGTRVFVANESLSCLGGEGSVLIVDSLA